MAAVARKRQIAGSVPAIKGIILRSARNNTASFSSSATRHAAPAKPVVTKQSDVDMWLAYTNSLRQKYIGNLGKQEAFYAAPASKLGIPVGNNIPKEITNKGVFDCADPMPLLDTPVYGASTQSYNIRVANYLGAVALSRNPDRGAQYRLNQAKAKSAKLMEQLRTVQTAAREAFNADEDKGSQTFKQWVPSNYPTYQSLLQEVQAASSTEASLRAQVEGPGADTLNRFKSNAYNAVDISTAYTGLNMPVVDVQADKLGDSGPKDPAAMGVTYRPSYTIDAGYADQVENWIGKAGADMPREANFEYSLQDAQKGKWADSGMSEFSGGGGLGFTPFFKVGYDVSGQMREEAISTEEAKSSLKVRISATGIQTFGVRPGAWDVPGMEGAYPKLESSAAFTFPGACKVTDLLMGYNVAMEIQMSSEMKKRVQEMAAKALQVGGYVSFFGIKVRLGGSGSGSSEAKTSMEQMFNQSDSTTVKIPGIDAGYPVLLGVKGTKLPEVKVGKAA